jgi:hypothetical protein
MVVALVEQFLFKIKVLWARHEKSPQLDGPVGMMTVRMRAVL